MNCADLEDLILDSLDGRLPDELGQHLAAHLAACPGCRAFLAVQVELDRSLAGLARLKMPPQFTRRMLERLDSSPSYRDLSVLLDLAGVLAAAAAAGFSAQHLLPGVGFGLPWVAATLVFSGGAWLALAEPPAPRLFT